ncbi:Snf7 family [Phakopsora pachyrhizi]|uniref:Snf7 family n=1 Tax=Phakopsora pachyrhizi TaxID=170000 RepID=A0AAV0B577_PHAPC|nr:Snf7 family [Phakopsora pachyrhizi]
MGQARSSNNRITSQDRAILDMKLQRDRLKQYQRRVIQILTLREQQIAREALNRGERTRAVSALRRKKYQENLLLKTDQQLESLQNLVSSVEFSLIEKDVLYGLSEGNRVLKEIHKEMDVESVEKLMSDTADGIAYQKEIDEMLMSRMTSEEEEEVQRELEILQAESVLAEGERIDSIGSEQPVSLPDVPQTDLPQISETSQPIFFLKISKLIFIFI